MSSSELAEWIAFYNLNPFGPEVDDLRFGISASMFANANRDPKSRRQSFNLGDFMMSKNSKPRPNTQTWKEQLIVVEMLNKKFGGKDLRGE